MAQEKDMVIFGEKLKEYRKNKGLTQHSESLFVYMPLLCVHVRFKVFLTPCPCKFMRRSKKRLKTAKAAV